ncbi:MAG: hypothetical protein C0404_05770 [Verrucomicrobia bacterium]|nr:hypothetical protein [Verrucomicrobiota bacterium]
MKKRPKQPDEKKGGLTAPDLLAGVPHVNKAARMTRKPAGALVEVPTRKPGYLVPPISWIIRFSGSKRVELDELGVDIMNLCDGRRTVEMVVEAFAVANKLSFRESQLPVIQFLTMLSGRGILAIAFAKEDSVG